MQIILVHELIESYANDNTIIEVIDKDMDYLYYKAYKEDLGYQENILSPAIVKGFITNGNKLQIFI